jgi:hypothetical protein
MTFPQKRLLTMQTPSGTPLGANSPITWAQLGVIFAIVLAIVGPLTAALYSGIRDGQKETNDRLKSLEDHSQTPIAADVELKELLKAPNLMLDINEIKESLKLIPKLQQSVDMLQMQARNIQRQIHTVPP